MPKNNGNTVPKSAQRFTALEHRAWRELMYMDGPTLEYLAKNKDEIINTSFQQVVEQGKLEKSPANFYGYLQIRQAARMLDMMLALAED